jgi:NAD(P)-dependent dehydrogenase (short-subunit alcohol dehydrogenase family)
MERKIMDLQLKGLRALVTGSSAGIGYAIAELLYKEGATVYLNGRTQLRVDEALKRLHASAGTSGTAYGLVSDLATAEGANKLISELPDVDILINNVGIYEPKEFAQITDEDWLHTFEVNVMSGIRLSRHYIEGMRKRDWGRIVFISSESGVNIPSEMIHYGVTKTAQIAVARGLAETTVGTKITVNSVLPGPTASEGVEQFIKEMAKQGNTSAELVEKELFEKIRPTSLLKRLATSEEVASMVAYVCSPLAAATNGAALRVDGGVVRSIL